MRCQLEMRKFEARRDGASNQRPVAVAFRRLPCVRRNDRLRHVAGCKVGDHYKFAVAGADARTVLRADPMARAAQLPPDTASIVEHGEHAWRDGAWMAHRSTTPVGADRLSIYEVHLGSWRPGADGTVLQVTPASAGWTHVGFTVAKLVAGQRYQACTPDRETCLVVVAGTVDVDAGEAHFEGMEEACAETG